jgi:hypothetical protein
MHTAGARRLREDERYGDDQRRRDLRLVEPARRTVTITGQPTPARRRRSARQQQLAARPDRMALWAFLLGVFLLLVAVATAHAAV